MNKIPTELVDQIISYLDLFDYKCFKGAVPRVWRLGWRFCITHPHSRTNGDWCGDPYCRGNFEKEGLNQWL